MKKITKKYILVVGDVILDSYIYGHAYRLSPEAPVPIISIQSKEYRLGGAANVAANISGLGGRCLLAGIVGHDQEGMLLQGLLDRDRISYLLSVSGAKPTTHKTRIIANNQQIARLDNEDISPTSFETDVKVRENIDLCCKSGTECGAIIISDYNKGAVSNKVLESIGVMARSNNIPVFIDPKTNHRNFYTLGGCVKILTPNVQEAEALTGQKITSVGDIEDACRKLMVTFGCKYVLITRGPDGMSLCINANDWGRTPKTDVIHIPTMAKSVFDVSGAGDTVIATLALAYASEYTIIEAAQLANLAAGVVVGKAGTATVSLNELLDSMQAAGLDI